MTSLEKGLKICSILSEYGDVYIVGVPLEIIFLILNQKMWTFLLMFL